MNPNSLAFALWIGAFLLAAAWVIDWGASRNNHWSPAKRRRVRWITFPLAIAVSAFFYSGDANLRRTTLFEVAARWDEAGGRVWAVQVEHPGVPHNIFVTPEAGRFESAHDPVTLRVRFGPEGGEPLLDEVSKFDTQRYTRRSPRRTWRTNTFTIVPKMAGPHQLKVNAMDGVPPLLHLRIADPEKRDGKRAPGY